MTAIYFAITCLWLASDQHIPIFDAGLHLSLVINVYQHLNSGHIWQALTLSKPYPPFAYLIGSLGLAVGGLGTTQPIIAENLVFGSLLALGCYNVGKLAFGRLAGLLAVVFAFGSPMITAQFHVFMIDAPETAMVALCLWAILATERFERVGVSALAGLAVGLGMLTKEPLAIFVAGPLAVSVIGGGWRQWRGLAVFAAVAIVVSLWWYIAEHSQIHQITAEAAQGGIASYDGGIAPPRGSLVNYEWYFWNMINWQLLLPLFLFAAVGFIWTIVGLLQRRSVSRFAPELAVGAFVAWLGLTETFVHDNRYGMPLLVYPAVFGSFWIARLPRARLIAAAAAALVAIAIINTLGDSAGAGPNLRPSLADANTKSQPWPGVVSVFSTAGYLVSAPKHEGDLLAVMQDLKRRGVKYVWWTNAGEKESASFSNGGLEAYALIVGLNTEFEPSRNLPAATWRKFAVIAHRPLKADRRPPCLVLGDGKGVWIWIGNPDLASTLNYCPSRRPQFY